MFPSEDLSWNTLAAVVRSLDENDLSDYETKLVFFGDIFDMEEPENEYRYLYGNAGGELKIFEYIKYYIKYTMEKLF